MLTELFSFPFKVEWACKRSAEDMEHEMLKLFKTFKTVETKESE